MGRARLATPVLLALLATATAVAEEAPPPDGATRTEELGREREAKRARLAPDSVGRVERFLTWLRESKTPEKLATPGAGHQGIRPQFGSVSPGSGLAAGIRFDRPADRRRPLEASWSYATSVRRYRQFAVGLGLPARRSERIGWAADLRIRHLPQEGFYGLGSSSSRADRVSFLEQEMSVGLSSSVRVARFVKVGARGSWIDLDIGRGQNGQVPSIEERFGEGDAPGLERQPAFLRGELYAELDWRDKPGNPRRGGLYRVSLDAYDDRRLGRHDHRRLTAELRQYVSFSHGHRSFAFRALTSLADTRDGQVVPFYLEPTLGGSDDLRGFDRFRFRDRHQLILNLEYRWEAGPFLDMAVFADAGKVFALRSELDLKRLESDAGIGLRFKGRKGVFLRADLARGREGFKLNLAAGSAF